MSVSESEFRRLVLDVLSGVPVNASVANEAMAAVRDAVLCDGVRSQRWLASFSSSVRDLVSLKVESDRLFAAQPFRFSLRFYRWRRDCEDSYARVCAAIGSATAEFLCDVPSDVTPAPG